MKRADDWNLKRGLPPGTLFGMGFIDTENVEITTSNEQMLEAFRLLKKHRRNLSDLTILYKNEEISLSLIANGGLKKVYEFGSGRVLFLPNMDADMLPAIVWPRVVKEEVQMSKTLKGIGLLSQSFVAKSIKVSNIEIPVIVAPSFHSLLQQGMQIRDPKRVRLKEIREGNNIVDWEDISYGESMLFSTKENLQTEQHWERLLKHCIEDAIIYLSNRVKLDTDSLCIVILDTDETTAYERGTRGLFTDRNQVIRLFFQDFSEKGRTMSDRESQEFISSGGQILYHNIRAEAEKLFDRMIGLIISGATNYEAERINKELTGVIDDLFFNNAFRRHANNAIESLRGKVVAHITQEVVNNIKDVVKERSSSSSSETNNVPMEQVARSGIADIRRVQGSFLLAAPYMRRILEDDPRIGFKAMIPDVSHLMEFNELFHSLPKDSDTSGEALTDKEKERLLQEKFSEVVEDASEQFNSLLKDRTKVQIQRIYRQCPFVQCLPEEDSDKTYTEIIKEVIESACADSPELRSKVSDGDNSLQSRVLNSSSDTALFNLIIDELAGLNDSEADPIIRNYKFMLEFCERLYRYMSLVSDNQASHVATRPKYKYGNSGC